MEYIKFAFTCPNCGHQAGEIGRITGQASEPSLNDLAICGDCAALFIMAAEGWQQLKGEELQKQMIGRKAEITRLYQEVLLRRFEKLFSLRSGGNPLDGRQIQSN